MTVAEELERVDMIYRLCDDLTEKRLIAILRLAERRIWRFPRFSKRAAARKEARSKGSPSRKKVS